MKIRVKITLLFTLLVMGILGLISFSVYYFSEKGRQEVFKQRLQAGANNRANLFVILGENKRDILYTLDTTSQSVIAQRGLLIFDGDREAYRYFAATAQPFQVSQSMVNEIRRVKLKFFRKGNVDVAAVYQSYKNRGIVVFYMGNDLDGKGRVADLARILLFSLLVGSIITLITGYIFSTQLVRPLNRIIKEVTEVSVSNLSSRIYAGQGQDELSRLATTFNDLLGRLQESMNIQKRFISNASHELSTPLTSISSQLQVTLNKERTANDYQKVLFSIQEDVEHMRQLTKSLLEIAKTGYEGGGIELTEVRIDEIMLKIVADVKKINVAYNVELEFGEFPDDDKACLTYGNPDLLYIAVKNIAENACKYSYEKQAFLYLKFEDNDIIVQVKNFGAIIGTSELESIFHPFYRGRTAGETKGFGLGLSLSQRIIAIHKGRVAVSSDDEKGTVFTITLPSLNTY